MMFKRFQQSSLQKEKKSILLLGPRQCGKSTVIRECKPDLSINLAREAEFLSFSSRPETLDERIALTKPRTVFIDEIQRLPSLLNTVQAIVDESANPIKFYLTGSSARKLKRGQANLLPGRVRVHRLGPLIWSEFAESAPPIQQLLSTGTLPGVMSESTPSERQKTLRDYSGTYLREEIQAEALAKDIEGFSRLLLTVGAWSGEFMDVSKVASASQIKRLSAIRYLEIIEDTLIVERLSAFAKSEKKRLIQHPKFYFFDVGVWNGLMQNFSVSADRVGKLFETFFLNQLATAFRAADRDVRISTYRTEHDAEVDLIVEVGSRTYAVELKASKNVDANDLRGIRSFQDYFGKKCHSIVATLSGAPRMISGVPVLPWQDALAELTA